MIFTAICSRNQFTCLCIHEHRLINEYVDRTHRLAEITLWARMLRRMLWDEDPLNEAFVLNMEVYMRALMSLARAGSNTTQQQANAVLSEPRSASL